MSKAGLGFGASLKEKENRSDLLREVRSEDLMQFGFESEFVGRLPVVAVLEDLDKNDLFKILKNRYSSVVTAKKQDFKSYGIDVTFTDDALAAIANMAHQEKTGARALVSVMEKILVGFERTLPSTEVARFAVTGEVVADPRRLLKEIQADENHPLRREAFDETHEQERAELVKELRSRKAESVDEQWQSLPDWGLETVVNASMKLGIAPETMLGRFRKIEQEIHDFEAEFDKLYGLKIRFGEEALQELMRLVLGGSEEALTLCRKIFQNYHHGLKLVLERTGDPEFTIPKEAIDDPERYLNDIIQQTYRQQDAETEG